MDLEANLAAVRERMAAACGRAGREPGSVALLAVTKSHPPEVVSEAARGKINSSRDIFDRLRLIRSEKA